jgi:agmatinase
LFIPGHSAHVGIRGPLYGREDLLDDAQMGSQVTSTYDLDEIGLNGVVERLRERVDGYPVYLS